MRLRSPLWGYIFFMGIVILVGLIVGFFRVSKIAKRVVCGTQLKALTTAMQVYMDTSEGQYPTSDTWCDLIMQNPGELIEETFCCPADSKGSFSYAINENLYKLESGQGGPQMVAIFEANLGRNGVGGLDDLVLRHDKNGQKGCNIAFVDGHMKFITEDKIADLKWTAE